MLKRLLTSVVALPFVIFIVLSGGILLKLLVMALSIVGMIELYKAFSHRLRPIHYIGLLYAVAYVGLMGIVVETGLSILIALFILSVMAATVVIHDRVNVLDASITIFGFVYVCFLISNIYAVRMYSYGQFFVWMIFISAWGSDTGAYIVGRKWGKHKLISLSPKKTVEGAVGGVVMATLLSIIYALLVSRFSTKVADINIVLLCSVIGCIASVFSQIGDLSASAIKRYTNIKDFGKFLPGHGGVLDRFDSILFTAPIVFIVMRVLLDYF